MNVRLRLLAACVAALPAAAAFAQQPHIRPGLWEETVSVKSDNAQMNAAMEQMKQRMAAMTPEQRAAMEKAMAGRGVGMNPGAPNTMRVCVTKEQIARGFRPEERGHCQRTNISTSGNVTKFEFACQSERGGSINGKGVYTELSDTAFTVSTAADMVNPKMTMHIQNDMTGKFISSDCGDVKPAELPPAK
ncbi:MAG TPA: DUF3617 domain-containing protein [Burkholderiaceae bacterium]